MNAVLAFIHLLKKSEFLAIFFFRNRKLYVIEYILLIKFCLFDCKIIRAKRVCFGVNVIWKR